MEERHAADLISARKRRFSGMLRNRALLRAMLRIAAWFKAPRQPVGAVGVVFDDLGRVLLVEHVFRTDFPWGLPGGWVERGEDPRDTVRREVQEELGLSVDVGSLLLSEQIGLTEKSTHPPHLGLAFACRLLSGTCRVSSEVVSVEWVSPGEIQQQLAPFQSKAIRSANSSRHSVSSM
jgi:8-oxo-dGTP pyrophosphatase MutT (NUDIX family)